MTIGMLWFDPSNKPLAEKLARAAAYYAEKYGQAPNLAYLHPSQAEGESSAGLVIRKSKQVLPNHFWIGVEKT